MIEGYSWNLKIKCANGGYKLATICSSNSKTNSSCAIFLRVFLIKINEKYLLNRNSKFKIRLEAMK